MISIISINDLWMLTIHCVHDIVGVAFLMLFRQLSADWECIRHSGILFHLLFRCLGDRKTEVFHGPGSLAPVLSR
jgi:hypothetical protein